MRIIFSLLLLIFFNSIRTQSLNLNQDYIFNDLRTSQLNGDISSNISFTLRPFDINDYGSAINSNIFNMQDYAPTLLSVANNKIKIKILPVDYNFEYNSNHPYKTNNGSMIPNRGYQHIISAGLYAKIGPLTIQLKPEHLYSENKDFEGFGEGPNGHYPEIWAKRYLLWNRIDMPERFGDKRHNKKLIGQSSIKLNFKSISLGISNENIWWGPSIRNSIMMSNNARGFKHITFNTNKPINTKIGNFEWQIISGRLESSGFTPSNIDYEYAGTKLYIPKINQLSENDDWRYIQGFNFIYSPKWIPGLSLGFIRWVQMYSALVRGKYFWMDGNPTWFPAFKNLFRKNDVYENYEAQTNQGAGLFFRWLWEDSKSEIYGELHYNDSKQNIRDLILDTDHSRALTLGLQKIFKIQNNDFLFSWEWTQMEQTASRLLRNANSWYMHFWTFDGYTNEGEVLGSAIGPGSNSQYFSLNRIRKKEKIGLAFEIIEHDNDFYYEAFASAQDPRRYWKDFNIHLNYSKKFKKIWISSNFVFSRNLNYQWDLDDTSTTYYHPGNDKNNFHCSIKLTYLFPSFN